MTKPSGKLGFTLVEMLISMSVLTVVLTAVVSIMIGTLRFSAATTSTADRLEELNGASAYVSDTLRRAVSVFSSIPVTANGTSFTCAYASGDCLATIVPEAQAGDAIDSYVFLAYRLEPRSNLGSDYKVPNSWADSNTRVLMEYRQELCGPSTGVCAGVPNPTSISGATAFFVADSLVLANELAGHALSYGGNGFTLRLQVKDRTGSDVRYSPSDGPTVLTVQRRN